MDSGMPGRPRRPVRKFLPCLLLLCLTGCALQQEATPLFDDLQEIAQSYQAASAVNLYQFPPPRDPLGRNLFRLLLDRLNLYAQNHPTQEGRDVLAFMRGGCLMRLGAYQQAALAWEDTPSSSPLKQPALTWKNRAEQLSLLRQSTPGGPALEDWLKMLEKREEQLQKLWKKWEGTEAAPFVRREWEQCQREKALFLFRHRFLWAEGAEPALKAGHQLLKAHKNSARRGQNHLLMARFYLEMAQDYAVLHPPDLLEFEMETLLYYVEKGRDYAWPLTEYDGQPEKFEATALLKEAEALVRRARRDGQ